MSIYNINNPITLTESDADAFLRDKGITLYEDSIAIDGTLYEGTYGESILEASGIFLYEDGIVLEGKQAEEYWERKQNANYKLATEDRNNRERRYNTTYDCKHTYAGDKNRRDKEGNFSKNNVDRLHTISRSDHDRRMAVADAIKKELSRRGDGMAYHRTKIRFNKDVVSDALNRHMRRHPKQYAKPKNESTIFSDIDII